MKNYKIANLSVIYYFLSVALDTFIDTWGLGGSSIIFIGTIISILLTETNSSVIRNVFGDCQWMSSMQKLERFVYL